MDPIAGVYEITLTVRAPEGSEVAEATVTELEAALEEAAVELFSAGNGPVSANAIAKRTDR